MAIYPYQMYRQLSLSRSPRDSLKHSEISVPHFEISVPQHIRFAQLRKKWFEQPHFKKEYVIDS